MRLNWQHFDNFFSLYDLLKNRPRMFYVIGETHHCYIGSVGGCGGNRGLAQRYEKQYIERTKAIFGSNATSDQPAFASIIDDQEISQVDIVPIERQLQNIFIGVHGINNALFTPRGLAANFQLTHTGDVPSFLADII